MFSLRQLTLLALCTTHSFVSAHITPTAPIAGAQYQGDQTQILKWDYNEDDMNGNPFVAERFKCDLMWGNDHWVALLAWNLSIYDQQVTVYFRSDYGFDSTAYYIRYTTDETNSIVNTDRFTLSQMNGTNFSQLFNEQPDPNVVSHGSGGSPPPSNTRTNSGVSVVQVTTSSSRLTSGQIGTITQARDAPIPTGSHPALTSSVSDTHSGTNQSTSQAGGPIGPLGGPTPSLGDTKDSESTSTGNQSGAVSLVRQRDSGSAWQKASLALWPVLVGAVMAM